MSGPNEAWDPTRDPAVTKARLQAVEDLVVEALQLLGPERLQALLDAAAEPADAGGLVQAMPDRAQLGRIARRQLLTRARYPGGLLSADELAELGDAAAAA